jgi:photosystem II stability/assembly factor-like uncharacterized protein
MKELISITLLLFFCIPSNEAQVNLERNKPVSIQEEVRITRNLIKDVKGIKGSGYKQKERYLNHIEDNQFEGKTTNYTRRIINAFNNYQKNNDPSIERARFAANWEYYGADSHTWVSPLVSIPFYSWYGTNLDEYRTSGGWSSGVGRINCIEFDPSNPSTIYVGTAYGGIWKSIDAGNNWININNNLPNISISDIAINPTNTSIIYLLTGDYDGRNQPTVGLLKSTNGGNSWSATGLAFSVDQVAYCSDVKLNPKDPTEIYVGCTDNLYRSVSSGIWFSSITSGNISDIEFHQENTDTLYYADECKINMVYDNATTIEEIYDYDCTLEEKYRVELAVTPHFPDALAAVSSRIEDEEGGNDNSFNSLMVSKNGGTTFQVRSTSPNMMNSDIDGTGAGGQGNYDIDVEFVPTDTSVIYIAGVNLWKSSNGGFDFDIQTHWYRGETTKPYVHADIHDIAFNTGSKPYLANDGGISVRNTLIPTIYYDLTNDMGINQFYDIDIINQNTNRIIGASQDNGVNYLDAPGAMKQVRGADGTAVMYDHNNPNKYYSSRQYGGLEVTTDNGVNWNFIKPQNAGNFSFVTDYVMHPTNSNIIFGAVDHIARTIDGGATSWSTFNIPDNTRVLRTIDIGKNDPNILYVAQFDMIWRVDNCLSQNPTITNVTSNLPTFDGDFSIKKIAVNPSDAMEVFITMNGYSAANKVFKSADGGATWTNISNGLPNVPIYCLLYEDGSNELLYAGTAIGVFYRENGSSWTSFNNGLPPVQVNDLEINYNTREIYAGTFGRGIYRRDLLTTNCPEVINLTTANDPDPLGNTMTQEYDANHTINSSRTIEGSNANVIYNANKKVVLKPGFKAASNSKFKAILKICN